MSRIEKNNYYMQIACDVASRSTCNRRKVGAVVVKDDHILATGFNGAPTHLQHCAKIGCLREKLNIPSGERHEICRGVHAEQNAIIQCALHGGDIANAELYCTTYPCAQCAKMLINSKISRIYYIDGYPDEQAGKLLNEAGIDVIQLDHVQAD